VSTRLVVGTVPPIRRTIVVPLERQAAFHLFVYRMADWWPLATRSVLLTESVSCHIEPRDGGRVFERGSNGREVVWGTVLAWDEPKRVAFSWHPGMPGEHATEVEVTFSSLGKETLVEVEHRHWERMGDRAAFVRGLYEDDGGWPGVLARFAELARGGHHLPPTVGPGCSN
jgi:uncharacterized protein YndB with AHSA1/START domain